MANIARLSSSPTTKVMGVKTFPFCYALVQNSLQDELSSVESNFTETRKLCKALNLP